MGSPISPVLADFVMEEFEETAISTFPYSPKWWFRYVDDSHSCLRKDQVDKFHEQLNSVNPNIPFTLELENTMANGQGLPFLDTTTSRCGTEIQVDVYRKPTRTDRYLDFSSCHHLCHKRSVVNTLLKRANNIPSTNKAGRREGTQRAKTVMQDGEWPIKYPSIHNKYPMFFYSKLREGVNHAIRRGQLHWLYSAAVCTNHYKPSTAFLRNETILTARNQA